MSALTIELVNASFEYAIAAAAVEPGGERQDGVPVIVSAGRLADAKNWPLFVDALARLAVTQPFRAVVLGQGEREAEIRRRLADAGLTSRVELLGFQSNPWKFMARADVFLLTSRYEGFGNVLIEAMACGVPLIATTGGALPEVVGPDGDAARTVAPGDADALARIILELLDDPDQRARLGAAGRDRARTRFTWAACADGLVDAYRALLDAYPDGGRARPC